jgi:hypothetical protein
MWRDRLLSLHRAHVMFSLKLSDLTRIGPPYL